MENNSLKIRMLVISELSGTITQDEKALLDQLRNEYPEIQSFSDDIYRKLENITDSMLMEERPSVEEIFELIDRRRPKVFSLRKFIKAACITGICMTGAAIFYYYYYNKNKQDFLLTNKKNVTFSVGRQQFVVNGLNGLMESNRYLVLNTKKEELKPGIMWLAPHCKITVPVGKTFEIRLSDSTTIFMEPESYAEFPLTFSDHERKVKIRGEAYLVVKKDAGKPFIVSLPDNTVTVKGTKFNVNTNKDGEENVALVEGSVNITNSKYSVALKAGEQVFLHKNNSTKTFFNKDSLLNRRQVQFTIDDVPIDTIPGLVQKYFAAKLIIDRTAKGKITIIVLDRNKTLEDFLNRYTDINGLTWNKQDSVYHIY